MGIMIRFYNKTFILLFFLIINSSKFYPQIVSRSERISMEDGLSGNTIYSILQDSRGFLWIGTNNGLNRFDGYNIKVYTHDPDDNRSLCYIRVTSMYEDRSGILWIGTRKGLNKYNRETDDFSRYTNNPNNSSSLSNNKVTSIYEDSDSILWIGTSGGGLNKFNRETETFIHYLHDTNDSRSISSNSINKILESKNGDFWIATSRGLNKYDSETNEFSKYLNDPNDINSLSYNVVSSIYEDRFENIWLGTYGGGINKLVPRINNSSPPTFLNYKNDPTINRSIRGNQIVSIIEDNTGELWIGSYDGWLNKFNPTSGQSLRDGSLLIKTIYKDHSGLIWYGGEHGVYKLDTRKLSIKHYTNEPDNPKSYSGLDVNSILEYKKNIIWIGSSLGGLNKFLRDKEEFVHYRNNPNNPRSISNNRVGAFCKDEDGSLWIGTRGGLNKLIPGEMDKTNPSFIHYKHNPDDPSSISSNILYTLLKDSEGTIWIGTNAGVSKLPADEKDNATPKFINYRAKSNDSTSLISNTVTYIYEDKLKNIWLVTLSGLDKYDKQSDTFIHYNHNPNDPNSLSDDFVMYIYEDQSANLWVGTQMGLNKFDRKNKRFERYTKKDGLADDLILSIIEDDDGNLWMSTNSGISKFNPKTESFINYDKSDGFQAEYTQKACIKSSSGELYFGGTDGFELFHPDDLKDNTHIPQIVITDFQINNTTVPIGFDSTMGRSVLEKSIVESEEIQLLHNENIISFEFSALDYRAPGKNQYAYMMEGFDSNWKKTNAARRYVTYTNLDPGEYLFRVKGSNNDGYWNEEGASIKIIIFPPWWATWWAYSGYVLLALSLLYGVRRYELNRSQLKNQVKLDEVRLQEKEEADKMKSRFFTNISHEFRTPLTLMMGPAIDVIEKTKEPYTRKNVGTIKTNAARLFGLVNQLLDLSKLEAGKMTLETREINIIPLLKGLVLSFSSMAERKKIMLNFSTKEESLNVYIDKDKVEKIINNLLSNAFKFTPEGGNIECTVEKLIDEAEIRISDSGVGIPEDRIDKIFDRFYQVDGSHTREGEGTGIGLALTKELVELHKGKIKVESKAGEGTTLIISIPLGKKHLQPGEIIEEEFPEKPKISADKIEPVPELENRKQKTDIDLFIDADKSLLLVVEDNTDVRKYVIDHLEDDYRIQEAVDGKDGMEQALNRMPDLIISDVMMPKMDGFELCNKLKTDEKTSHIPIILLTAKATSEDKIEGYETGADDYIMKPFDAAELKVRVKNLIENRRKIQGKFSSDGFSIPKELNPIDERFLKKVLKVINEHISEENFSIELLSKESAMSKEQIYKKLKALTGKSPSLFLRSIRLAKAKKMIKENKNTISEISYLVGFSSPAYFTKCFKEEFGSSPSDLIS
ncbi:MAG: response regulator [Candidatus Cloacimonetes bacterium]|nr:response regulator [Candidatus Cloacimonadota bacterium]